ncbi:protein of unknown function [[Clostridium] ultunense Esp]|uniref:Uncharacterized protein n=1 Tax=[Clostridium] ultunense Esp TaxID=1288971 RepID=A0A1M4PJ75_9FIRM|nr:protein of unknown function [[Clostridium] ultunense Esp]
MRNCLALDKMKISLISSSNTIICALSKFDYSDLTRKFRLNLDNNFSNLIL